MVLVVAEKPMLGRAIADAIPGKPQDNSSSVITKQWNGDTIKIVWCFGHMMQIKEPEDYDEQYKKWNLNDLPFYFPGWEKKVDPKKMARVKEIGALMKSADTVIHAGDLDDEGQSIVDELLDYFHYNRKVLRLDTVDVTPAALLRSLNHMDDNANHTQDGVAAYARQVCDAMFGFNLTRFYSLKNPGNGVIAIGRVQTPTLGLVVQRDLSIEQHVKKTFYTLSALVDLGCAKVWTKFVPAKDNERLEDGYILDRKYLDELQSLLKGRQLSPCVVTDTESTEAPPLPFNTTKLNSYCGSRWGMSPKDVLTTTQTLRDKYKCISYNRSECRYLKEESFSLAPGVVAAACKNLGLDSTQFDTTIKSKAFNDAKTTGPHTGIIPTDISVDVSKFTTAERNVYEAICLYFLVQFMKPAKKKMFKLNISVSEHGALTASASEYTFLGYRALLKGEALESEGAASEEESDDSDDSLRTVPPGSYTGTASDFKVKEGETKPPSYYTQSTLEEDMTRIARYCKNEGVKKLLLQKDKDKTGENGSIGTSATRPDIIQGLLTHGLLEEFGKGKKKYIRASLKGRHLFNALPDNVRGVDVTAKWWCLTEDIKAKKYTPEQMIQNVLMTIKAVLESGAGEIEGLAGGKAGITGDKIGVCPKCGGDVYETAKGFKCTADGCKFMLWKDQRFFERFGKKITPKCASMFLSKGRVGFKNLKSPKTGKSFDAIIVADFSGDYPNFQFEFENSGSSDKETSVIGKCPKCGSDFLDKGSRCVCSNDSCKLVLFRTSKLLDKLGHKQFTTSEVKQILSKKEVTFDGKDKNGKRSIRLLADFSTDYVRFSFPERTS